MTDISWFVLSGIIVHCVQSYVTVPQIGYPQITKDGKEFTQSCDFYYNGTNEHSVFTLKWLFGTQIYKLVTLTRGVTSDMINSSDWAGHLGEKLFCSVSYHVSGSSGDSDVTLTSNAYTGTLTITPVNLALEEGSETSIDLISTLPIVCPHVPLDKCKMELEMILKGGYSGDILTLNACNVHLTGTDWDLSTGTATASSTLASVIDPVFKTDTEHIVSYRVKNDSSLHPIWSNYETNTARVNLSDDSTKICMQLGNHHIYGMSGKRLKLDFNPGDYLLFKATSNTGKLLQVQTRHASMVGGTCAVAVQYGISLIIINMCIKNQMFAAPYVSQGTVRPKDLRVYRCGSDYEIFTGDGIHISVNVHRHRMDVKLHVPDFFKKSTEGTCFLGSEQHMTMNQSGVNRITVNESLFSIGGKRFFSLKKSTTPNSSHYCNCYGKKNCGPFGRIRNPVLTDQYENICKIIEPHSSDLELDRYIFTTHKVFPFLNHIPTSTLDTQCRQFMDTRVPKLCKHLNAGNLDSFIAGCTEESQFAGRESLAIFGFKWMCMETTLSNLSNYRQGPAGELLPPAEMMSLTCSSMCYLRGKCVGGKCVCPGHLTGISCEIFNVHTNPRIRGIRGGLFCKRPHETCDEVVLFTTGIHDTGKLEAKILLLELHVGGFVKSPLIFHVKPMYENMNSAVVPLSQIIATLSEHTAVGFSISLTSDGIHYTNAVVYYIYDETCHLCTHILLSGIRCVLNEGTCKIKGNCYKANERNPENPKQICNPEKELLHWTEG